MHISESILVVTEGLLTPREDTKKKRKADTERKVGSSGVIQLFGLMEEITSEESRLIQSI